MCEKNQYSPLEEDLLWELFNKHKLMIQSFLENNRYLPGVVSVRTKSLLTIIAKVDQRRRYFEYFHKINMSEYKEVALICFWYIKIHPIYINVEVDQEQKAELDSINEKMAVYYILVTLRKILENKKLPVERLDDLPEAYIKELIYSMTYRDLSKESLILLVESMAVFLGLNPYQELPIR